MFKSKIQNPKRIACNLWSIIFSLFAICNLSPGIYNAFAQDELQLTLDVNSETVPLPKIYEPNIDLSGRGFHRDSTWPQTLAAEEALENWQKEIGFSGFYRLQYNLWEISQFEKNKKLQNKLLDNYENIIKKVSDSGGTVILNIFGTPAGMGKVLDNKSPPKELKAFKEYVKALMRDLSCNKKYNIWYEVWNTPNLEEFFLGRKQEYFNLYRSVAQARDELEEETKIHIPLGGPSVSWWFQNFEANSIASPEESLVYELIKYCYRYHLPLDFISWHGYSSCPKAENQKTIYNKNVVMLIRNWLTYFKFDKNTPLIVSEWNWDSNSNISAERQEKAFIGASYIPSRLDNMYSSGIDNQVYFCLEDFHDNKEGVKRNVGIFSFDAEHKEYKGAPKSIYNVFRMLKALGNTMYQLKVEDEFVGAIATKTEDGLAVLIYNYIDPETAMNCLTREIGDLNSGQRKLLLRIINSKKLSAVLEGEIEISALRVPAKVQAILKNCRQMNDSAKKFAAIERKLKFTVKNLKENYLLERYAVDSSCNSNCEFAPVEKKDIGAAELYEETLAIKPYSVQLLILKMKPKEPEAVPAAESKEPESQKK